MVERRLCRVRGVRIDAGEGTTRVARFSDGVNNDRSHVDNDHSHVNNDR